MGNQTKLGGQPQLGDLVRIEAIYAKSALSFDDGLPYIWSCFATYPTTKYLRPADLLSCWIQSTRHLVPPLVDERRGKIFTNVGLPHVLASVWVEGRVTARYLSSLYTHYAS